MRRYLLAARPAALILIAIFFVQALSGFLVLRRIAGGQTATAPAQTIASVSLSNNSFTGGVPSGTVVGSISTVMSPSSPSFTGSYSVTGTDAAHFQISGSNLETNGVVSAGTYSINVVATQAGISNSPFSQPETITGNAQTIASVNLSGTTYTPNTPNGAVGTLSVTMSPASPASTAALTITGANSGGFQLVGSGCSNISAGTCTLEQNSAGTTGAGPYTDVTIVATQASASNSPQSISPTLSGTTTGTVVATMTFTNFGSGTTPGAATPVHTEVNFPPGAVPLASSIIAIPSVGGVTVPYQIDCAQEGCPVWPDGSLKNAPVSLFLPTLAAGASEQVVWKTASGSYSYGSSITPAMIAAASHLTANFSGVAAIWVNNTLLPQGMAQVGCAVSAGSISGCVMRLVAGTVGTSVGFAGINCSNGTVCITGSNNTGTILTGGSSATLTFTTTAPAGAIGKALAIDVTTPANIPANTTVNSKSGSTVTLSAIANVATNDVIEFLYPIQGCTNAGFYATLDGANKIFTSVTVPAAGAGSGCSVPGSGAEVYDVNAILNQYGSIQPPTCAAAGGADSFNGTVSGSTLTNSGDTGALSKGQVITDSLGVTAVITGGSGTSWTLGNPSGTLTNGAMTARVPACMYASGGGSGMDMVGIRVRGPLLDASSASPDAWVRSAAYIEYWAKGGTLVTARGMVETDTAVWKPSGTTTQNNWPSETFSIDYTNGGSIGGAGEIRGAAQGTGPYTNLTTESPTAFYSADPALSGPVGISGTADWLGPTSGTFSLATSEAWNSVQPTPTSGDEAYIHASHAHMPLVSGLTVTPAVINATTGSSYGYAENLAYYKPLDVPFIDTNATWNGGGEHFYLAPDSAVWAFWYEVAPTASDHGAAWLQQMRVTALSVAGQAFGPYEDATGHPLRIDPSWTPPTAGVFTDPTREWASINCNNFQPQVDMCTGGQAPASGLPADPTHWPSGQAGAAASLFGDRWLIDNVEAQARNLAMAQFDQYNRNATLGSTTYYALAEDYVGERRGFAWEINQIAEAVQLLPPAEPGAIYFTHVLKENFDFEAAWLPYIGSMSTGQNYPTGTPTSGRSNTKNYDLSTLGAFVQAADYSKVPPLYQSGVTGFMDGYISEVIVKIAMTQDHAIPSIDTVYGYVVDNFAVGNAAANTCAYDILSYSMVVGNQATGQPLAGWDATDISTPQRPNFFTYTTNGETYAGSTLVTAVAGPTTAVRGQSAAYQYTASGSAAGTTIGTTTSVSSLPTCSGTGNCAFPNAVVNDVTNGTGPFQVLSASGTTITVASPGTSGTTAGDTLLVSGILDYPLGSGVVWPSGSLVWFTEWDAAQEFLHTPPVVGPWPPATSPANQVQGDTFYTWCADPSGVSGGTINPLGTNCASPAPITFTTAGAYEMGAIVNASCPAPSGTVGSWNGQDYQSYQGRFAQYWAIAQGDKLLNGSTANNSAALSHLTPTVTPLSTTFNANPRIAWDSTY